MRRKTRKARKAMKKPKKVLNERHNPERTTIPTTTSLDATMMMKKMLKVGVLVKRTTTAATP